MAFPQTTINVYPASGFAGTIAYGNPDTANAYVTGSPQASNIVGAVWCTISTAGDVNATPICVVGSSGARGVAGLLVDKNGLVNYGSSSDPLSPSSGVPQGKAISCATQGQWYAAIQNAANVGDYVFYDNTTGLLGSVAPGTALPAGKTWCYATVMTANTSAAGIAIINISPSGKSTT